MTDSNGDNAGAGGPLEPAASEPARAAAPVVMIIDDDDLMRAALRRIFVSAKIEVELYASGAEFLAQARFDRPVCILLDFNMPGMDGLEVQARLKQRGVDKPIIFLTGAADVPVAVSAMREGAIDFLQKPFDNLELITRVRAALERRRLQDERSDVLRRLSSLTATECRVLDLLIAGKSDREVARALKTGQRSVDVHRRRVMQKMDAPTLADLVRMRLLAAENALGADTTEN
jgi:two-component system response regulator FixJ